MVGRYSRELLELPLQAAAAARVIQLLDDEDASITELGNLIETDICLSAGVLRLANSAAYEPKRVSNVRQAMAVLAPSAVRAVALASTLRTLDGIPTAFPEAYWQHSVFTAAAAATLARLVGFSEADALCAGLLHDVGLLLGHLSYEVGGETFGARASDVGDAEAGASALAAWGFPDELVEAVRGHHDTRPTEHTLTLLVRAADAIALTACRAPRHGAVADPAEALSALSLTEPSLAELNLMVTERVEALAACLEPAR